MLGNLRWQSPLSPLTFSSTFLAQCVGHFVRSHVVDPFSQLKQRAQLQRRLARLGDKLVHRRDARGWCASLLDVAYALLSFLIASMAVRVYAFWGHSRRILICLIAMMVTSMTVVAVSVVYALNVRRRTPRYLRLRFAG